MFGLDKKQSRVFRVAERQVLQMLCSAAIGILKSLLFRAMGSRETIEGVHVRIMSDFVSEYIGLSKFYTRGQRQNESLLDFVEDISLMSEVSEREVVKVILAGTRYAEVRALLVLARPPSTLGGGSWRCVYGCRI